jgi:hypothetical protein
LDALNELIWSVDPSEDRLEGLADFVVRFAERFSQLGRWKLLLNVGTDLVRFSSAKLSALNGLPFTKNS